MHHWALALATAVTLGSAAPLIAQDGPPPASPEAGAKAEKGGHKEGEGRRGRRMMGGGGMERMAEKLGLSDAQKEQVKTILEGVRSESRGERMKLRDERRALDEAVKAPKVDEVAIRAQAAKVAALEADAAVQRANTLAKLRGVLTPEQIEKLNGGPGLDGLFFEGGDGPRRGGGEGRRRGPRGGEGHSDKKPEAPKAPDASDAGSDDQA